MESLNLKDTYFSARISREDTFSRRYSKSFRSNIMISSRASSPGYAINEKIDPSTYSFTKALEALQAKNIQSWDDMSAEGVALNSKWSEAERYICNPLSGEVPIECLSARTLSGRSFPQLPRGITLSAYPLHRGQCQLQIKHSLIATPQVQVRLPIPQETKSGNTQMVVGTQSVSPVKIRSRSLSPTCTPSIEERPIRRYEEESEEESPLSTKKLTFQEEENWKERSEEVESIVKYEEEKKKKKHIMCRRRRQCGGLLPWWWSLWMKRNQQDCKHRSRKKMFFFCHKFF